MSDPRNTDPYRNERSRSSGVGRSDQTRFWLWLTPVLTALGLLLGSYFGYRAGYNSGLEHSAQSSPSTTTGSAPSQQR
jgi:hypothetical protein